MPIGGSKKPRRPIPVLVQNLANPSSWDYGLMREWRWVDEVAGTWEGDVSFSADDYVWIPSSRLRRISP